MFIKVKDLELRRLEFDENFPPGAFELVEDVTQTAPLKALGRAELVRENRGGKNIVDDIRLVGKFFHQSPDSVCPLSGAGEELSG